MATMFHQSCSTDNNDVRARTEPPKMIHLVTCNVRFVTSSKKKSTERIRTFLTRYNDNNTITSIKPDHPQTLHYKIEPCFPSKQYKKVGSSKCSTCKLVCHHKLHNHHSTFRTTPHALTFQPKNTHARQPHHSVRPPETKVTQC